MEKRIDRPTHMVASRRQRRDSSDAADAAWSHVPLGRGVRKQRLLAHHVEQLHHRRVQVPQRYTEVPDDGDGFCFGGTVTHVDTNSCRAYVRFDYTGEVEAYSQVLVRRWLVPLTEGYESLCNVLEGCAVGGNQAEENENQQGRQ